MSMDLAKQVYGEYKAYIDSHEEEMKAGAKIWRENLEHSALFLKDHVISRPLMIPRLYTEETIEHFKEIVGTTYGIFDKVIRRSLESAEYRQLFPYSKELEELILAPTGCDCLLPLTRFDLFYHEDTGDFMFCEVNADGSTGMDEDRIQDQMMIHNPAHQEIIREHDLKTFELFDSWVETFLRLYSTFPHRVEKPTVAIVDFIDKGIYKEFDEFCRRFQKHGVNCEVADIRKLEFKDGKLYSARGHEIHAIYRRAVTVEVLEHYDEIRPFIDAVLGGHVFMTGGFCTQIVHNKWIFKVLYDKETEAFLTEKEIDFIHRHIPGTRRFAEGSTDINEVLSKKDSFILKPEDGYASRGVLAGIKYDEKEWKRLAEEVYNSDYICQDYCPQYKFENIDYVYGDGKWHDYVSLAGLYVYGGKFAGVFARSARDTDVTIDYTGGERRQVTYLVRS